MSNQVAKMRAFLETRSRRERIAGAIVVIGLVLMAMYFFEMTQIAKHILFTPFVKDVNDMTKVLSFDAKALRRAPKSLWVTWLDGKTESEVFKRHMVSKHLNGGIPWFSMSVFAAPDAPEDLIKWAADLDVEIEPVRARIGSLHAWCRSGAANVVFMRANTVIRRDVRGLIDNCAGEGGVCGASAGFDLPKFYIDAGVVVARPSARYCTHLSALTVNVTGPVTQRIEKVLINKSFLQKDRKLIDPRFNVIVGEVNTTHLLEDAIVIQYDPEDRVQMAREDLRGVLEQADRARDIFESRRRGELPKRVLYATMLTPAPEGMFTHSTTMEGLKEHHYSKFYFGKIPWENQAIIYTNNAFPEYRAWLTDKGGKTIQVPPMFCENGRDKRYKYQFTKLQFWKLIDYDYIVYTDLDTYITGDISRLWASCVDGIPLCGVEEPVYLPGRHYMNGGFFIVRPSKEAYNLLIEGRRTYKGSTWLCEQDYLNYFLQMPRIGVIDPKYNVMSFDAKRRVQIMDAKIVHFSWQEIDDLKAAVTESERDFLHAFKKNLYAMVSDESKPPIIKPPIIHALKKKPNAMVPNETKPPK